MEARQTALSEALDLVVRGEPDAAAAGLLARHAETPDAWLLALASFCAYFAQQHERAAGLAGEALAEAERAPADRDLTELARAAAGLADAGWVRTDAGDPLGEAAADVGGPSTADVTSFARHLAVEAALACARLDLAETLAERAGPPPTTFLETGGRPHPYLAVIGITHVRLLAFRGRIDAAAALFARVPQQTGASLVDLTVAGTGALIGGNAADRAAVRAFADRVDNAHPEPRDHLSAGCTLLAAYGLVAVDENARAAQLVLLAGRGADLASLAIVDRALGFEMLLAEAVLEGDLDVAWAWRARAEPLLDSPIANSTVARLISRVELLGGDAESAVRWADRAIELARAQGRVVEAMEGEIVAGRARIAATGSGTAHARLEAAVGEAEATGHHAVRRAAARELRAAGRRLRPRAGSGWAGLSERERAVARLLSAGRTNGQIAAELHLSEHTVRIHVSRVLAAFGASSRFAVASQLAELFPPERMTAAVPLTPRQRAVAERIALGWGNPQIAADLGVSVRTVEKHLGDIRRRSGVVARAEIARLALAAPAAAPDAPTTS